MQDLAELGSAAHPGRAYRPAFGGGNAARRAQAVEVAAGGTARLGGVGQGPRSPVPVQSLVQDEPGAAAGAPIVPHRPAVGGGAAGDTDELLAGTAAGAIGLGGGDLGPGRAIPVQGLVQGGIWRGAVRADGPAVGDRGAAQAIEFAECAAAGRPAGAGRGDLGPRRAVPAQRLVEEHGAAGLGSVSPGCPAVGGRRADDLEQFVDVAAEAPTWCWGGYHRPLLTVPVQGLVEVGPPVDLVDPDGPAIAGREAADAEEKA